MDSADEDRPMEYHEMLAEMMDEPIGELFHLSIAAETMIDQELASHAGLELPDPNWMSTG